MEPRSRSVRPYLIQSNEVDKFLRKQRLPSPYRRPLAYTQKFPTNETDQSKNATTNHSSPPLSTGTTTAFNGRTNSNNYSDSHFTPSSRSNTFLENKKKTAGRSPSVSTRKDFDAFIASLNGFDEKPAYGQQSKVDYYGQQQQKQEGRVIPIQIKADEARKHKTSALKTLRSFFKKHLGFSNSPHKRDYSAEPIGGKRFSSTLNLNSRLSSASSANPSEHRYSNSISSGLPRRQSFSFRNERTPERPLPALPNGVPFSQLAHDGERQRSLSMAEPEDSPQFDELMQRFSNISTTNHRPRLPSASMYQFPTKTGTTNVTTKFASSTLPPVPSAVSRQPRQQNSLSYLQPRPATSDVPMPREKSAADRELLKRQPSSSDGVPCLKGLMNHGNTCYFSAIIQCLACCEKFAEYFLCNGPDEAAMKSNSADQSAAHMPLLANALSATLRCLWFNNSSADSSCYQLLQRISKANPQFIISQQQDAHECLIWLLDRLHEEIMERETRGNNHIDNDEATIVHRMQKSEGELASDALERVSGTNRSTVMDLFRAQFRSAMECTNPVCGFTNLTFDPYSSISLSVPLPKRPSELSVLFIPFFGARQIIRYHFQLADPLYTIWDVKERVMQHVRALSEQAICCQIQPNGQCQFFSDNVKLDERIKEITLLELPKLNEQQQLQEMIVVIVVFVVGIVPDGERYGNPFVVVLNRHWSYERISSFLLEKGSFLLPRAYYPLPADYTLLIQHSPEQVACLDPGMAMPLFHEYINKTLSDQKSTAPALKLIVEWSESVRHEFQKVSTESVAHDYTFCRGRFQNVSYGTYGQDEIPIPLGTLIDDYVKRENILDWKCPKCDRSPGRKELKFHSLPNVLIFHLKRFELLNDGIASKIESRVQIPLEGLDMGPYVFNPDVRASTLPKHRRDKKESDYLHHHKDDTMYDLIGVVSHFGQRTNSGHYTATTHNPLDGQWRTFDDSRVSQSVGVGDIRVSTKSYLLFYERRPQQRQGDQPLTSSPCAKWFPSAVPAHVLDKYNNKGESCSTNNSCNGYVPLVRKGLTIFYTDEPSASENGGDKRRQIDQDDCEERRNRMRARLNGVGVIPPPTVPTRSASVTPTSTAAADHHRKYSANRSINNGSAFVRPSTATLYTPTTNRMAISSYSSLAYPRSSAGTRMTNTNYPRYSHTYKF